MPHETPILTPTTIVLIGATGDLAQKKLLVSFMRLFAQGLLPERFHMVATSRDEHTNESYRAFARTKILAKFPDCDQTLLTRFLETIEYVQGSLQETELFVHIKQALEAYDSSIGMCTNKLFYCAVQPALYETVFDQIAQVRLEVPCIEGEGWTRILVEKPFGNDLTHAQYLDKKLSQLFKEEQIYRIDHYLAKDALQNILAFRFSNVLFENRWNRHFIERVEITAYESFGVETRGVFFNGVGALRDVGQNHLLQMLALIGMEYPKTFSPEAIRKARARVLKNLVKPSPKDLTEGRIVKGQYIGFRDIPDVEKESRTETYFALETRVKNNRWRGVPFFLEHGKAMHKDEVAITIHFRSAKKCVCGRKKPHEHSDVVRFSISPEQKITMRLWTRKADTKYTLEAHDLVFDRDGTAKTQGELLRDAYEEVLFDALRGDQTLFVSSEEQTAQWRFITTILSLWENREPLPYKRGSEGPKLLVTK